MKYRLGWEWLRENPGKIPILLIGKLYRLLWPIPESPNRVFRLVVGLAESIFLPFYLAGLLLVMRSRELRRSFLPVWLMLVKLLALTLIFYGSMRFRGAVEPLLAVAAAVAVVVLARKLLHLPKIAIPALAPSAASY